MPHDPTINSQQGRARVLLVGTSAHLSAGPFEALVAKGGISVRLERAKTPAEIVRALRNPSLDLLVIDHDSLGLRGVRVAGAARRAHPTAVIIGVGECPAPASFKGYLQHGLAEWAMSSEWAESAAFVTRLKVVLAAAMNERIGKERLAILEATCRRLSHDRGSLEKRLGSTCAKLAEAESQTLDREATAMLTGECRALLSQEIEQGPIVELAANFLVTHTGPTNAALFVRDGQQFRLAAYVRDDLAKRSAGGILEHLCAEWSPAIARLSEPTAITEGEPVQGWLQGLSGVLPGRSVVVIPCRAPGVLEAAAVVVLFRSPQRPFGPDAMRAAKAAGLALGVALGKVDRIATRAKPSWPAEAPESDDSTQG